MSGISSTYKRHNSNKINSIFSWFLICVLKKMGCLEFLKQCVWDTPF